MAIEHVMVRMDTEVKEWLAKKAAQGYRSLGKEVLRIVEEERRRDNETEAEKSLYATAGSAPTS